MSTLCAQLQGKPSKSLKLIDTSEMLNWNIMSWMILKNIGKIYVALEEGLEESKCIIKVLVRKGWIHCSHFL